MPENAFSADYQQKYWPERPIAAFEDGRLWVDIVKKLGAGELPVGPEYACPPRSDGISRRPSEMPFAVFLSGPEKLSGPPDTDPAPKFRLQRSRAMRIRAAASSEACFCLTWFASIDH